MSVPLRLKITSNRSMTFWPSVLETRNMSSLFCGLSILKWTQLTPHVWIGSENNSLYLFGFAFCSTQKFCARYGCFIGYLSQNTETHKTCSVLLSLQKQRHIIAIVYFLRSLSQNCKPYVRCFVVLSGPKKLSTKTWLSGSFCFTTALHSLLSFLLLKYSALSFMFFWLWLEDPRWVPRCSAVLSASKEKKPSTYFWLTGQNSYISSVVFLFSRMRSRWRMSSLSVSKHKSISCRR